MIVFGKSIYALTKQECDKAFDLFKKQLDKIPPFFSKRDKRLSKKVELLHALELLEISMQFKDLRSRLDRLEGTTLDTIISEEIKEEKSE